MPTNVVFSMGDPHGIGPEVLLKSLEAFLPEKTFKPVVFGAEGYLLSLYNHLQLTFNWEEVEFFNTGECLFPPPWGETGKDAGQIALDSLRSAILHCRDEDLPLLVTAPVSKESLHLAGFTHPGQTEFLGSFFESSDPTMVFLSERLKLVLVTVHMALRDVFQGLTVERIVARSKLFYEGLRKLGNPGPRVAVCGLNPHASENGMFGQEEEQVIIPALRLLQETFGEKAFLGPYPPDTVFARCLAGEFDGVVAQYHDQGLIPLKLIAFESAVNTTLGLPIVRTSPDHGTAFDIAGKGIADPSSMIAAVKWGLRLCQECQPAGGNGTVSGLQVRT